ncbi:MAG: histidinol-phosphate transaminase [Myxococcota bacterium]
MTEEWNHGDVSDAELIELGLDPAQCLDFAVNVDPRGPAPALQQAVVEAKVGRYPDPACRELTAALALRDGVPEDRVLVGAGVTGLLWDVFRAVSPQTRVLVPQHTFAEYDAAPRAHGLHVETLGRSSADGWALDWECTEAWLTRDGPRSFVLGAPDNPSGSIPDFDRLRRLAEAAPQAWIVLDEAFLRLSARPERVHEQLPDNVLRLRSLTKELAIPGLRVGYMVACSSTIDRVRATAQPWSVGTPAQAAAIAGANDPSLAEDARLRMRADVEALSTQLREIGLTVLPTDTVYLLAEVPSATELARWCRARGVLVRDCSSFGLPGHIRLLGRPAADRRRLVTLLQEFFS